MNCGILPEGGFQPANTDNAQGLARHFCPPSAGSALDQALACLLRGGVVIYPASTFYAIGSLSNDPGATELVFRLKGREQDQPLPLLAANMEQVAHAVNAAAIPQKLARAFWPGPLTILAPAVNVCRGAFNARGQAAIRVDTNPLARELAFLAGYPLTASSANISGHAPAARLEDLEETFLERLRELGEMAHVLIPRNKDCEPHGGLPSTIVEVLPKTGNNGLRVLRQGAISNDALEDAGFLICG